jgi:hypothetical protein
VEVWFFDFIKTGYPSAQEQERTVGAWYTLDTKDPRIQFETWDPEIVWNIELVELAPDARHGL